MMGVGVDKLEKAWRSDMRKKNIMAVFWIALFILCVWRVYALFTCGV